MVTIIKKNIWIILILLLAIGLRMYRLDYLELFGDEVDAGYQSYSILLHAKDYRGNWLPPYMESFSEWRAPGLMYTMVPFIKLLGLNEWGVRMPSVFFGVLGIYVFYLLLCELGVKNRIALLSSLFVSVLPWHIQYSRSGFELTLMSFFLLLATYFWLKYLKLSHNFQLILAGILYSSALYTYNTANLYVPILVLISTIIVGWNFDKLSKLFVVGLILCLPLLANIIWGSAASRFKLFSVWGNKSVTEEVIEMRNSSNNKFSPLFYNKLAVSTKKILFNYSNAFSTEFLFGKGDITFRHSLHYVGNLYWVYLPLLLLGIFGVTAKNDWTKSNKFMLLFLLISPIPSSLTIDGYNHASRLFMLIFPICFWSSTGFEFINNNRIKTIFLLVLLYEVFNFQFYYWNNYKNDSWRWWHTGYKEIMLDISKISEEYRNILIDNVYEPSLVRYLFWNKVDPATIYGIADQMKPCSVDGFEGFSIPNSNVYFVNFNGPIKSDLLKKDNLYMFSQDINVVGDRDLNTSLPPGIDILKTVRNSKNIPIFYLVRGK